MSTSMRWSDTKKPNVAAMKAILTEMESLKYADFRFMLKHDFQDFRVLLGQEGEVPLRFCWCVEKEGSTIYASKIFYVSDTTDPYFALSEMTRLHNDPYIQDHFLFYWWDGEKLSDLGLDIVALTLSTIRNRLLDYQIDRNRMKYDCEYNFSGLMVVLDQEEFVDWLRSHQDSENKDMLLVQNDEIGIYSLFNAFTWWVWEKLRVGNAGLYRDQVQIPTVDDFHNPEIITVVNGYANSYPMSTWTREIVREDDPLTISEYLNRHASIGYVFAF